VVAFAGSASAQLSINWKGDSGWTLSDESTPLLQNGAAPVQLSWSVSAVISPASTSGATGDNVILDSATVTEASVGNPYGGLFSYQYDNPVFSAGSVFVRVFAGGSSELAFGTEYFDGPLYENLNNPVPPQLVSAGDAGAGPGPFGTYALNQTVIPEPSVMALMGLGGLLMAIRRRRMIA
jgi:hypothetical protein